MLSREEYTALRPLRARGLKAMAFKVGNVCEQIEPMLANSPRLRVLELGCGFGTVLLELERQYPGRLELYGINADPEDGDDELMAQNALELGLWPHVRMGRPPLPALMYCDISKPLPYPDRHFDLVVSQSCILHVADKVGCIREVARVLSSRGKALLDLKVHPTRYRTKSCNPSPYDSVLEIWDGGDAVDPWSWLGAQQGATIKEAVAGLYLELAHSLGTCEGVELVVAIDLKSICEYWIGKKSIYRCTASARPDRPTLWPLKRSVAADSS